MTDQELSTIKHFSKKEIENSGGNVFGLNYDLFIKLDKLRDVLGWPMKIPTGGLNSGKHISNTDVHALGEACDFFRADGLPVDYTVVFRAAVQVDFNGIGIYWNGYIYSFHVDVRNYQAYWYGVHQAGATEWIYKEFKIVDPKGLI
jgi:hypothetical protein